jgi:hypothetical protein
VHPRLEPQHGRTGNSITIFENVEQGPGEKLQLVTQVFTELNQIRGALVQLVERTTSI